MSTTEVAAALPGSPTCWLERQAREARRRPRADGLSSERIIQAALALVDAEGLEALTVRRLAEELATGSASLYRHVAKCPDGDEHALEGDQPIMLTHEETTTLTTTRRSLQAVAEHVLSAALHAATGHIGLRRTPGGFGTPGFDHEGHRRQIVVDGTDIEVRDGDGARRAPITTLRAAGELAEIDPGVPRDVYTPTTPLVLDALLVVGAEQAELLADWYGLVDEAIPPRQWNGRPGTGARSALARALRSRDHHRRGELRWFARRRGPRSPVSLRRPMEPTIDGRLLERDLRREPVR